MKKCEKKDSKNIKNPRLAGIIRMEMKCPPKYIKHPLCITGLVVIKVGKAGLNLLDI
jgi:hypothetical protein